MPRPTGPKKVRIPGTNRWVVEGSLAEITARAQALNAPPPAPEVDEFDESGWEVQSDLGERPERIEAPAVTHEIPHYYHAYYPHLRVRRGRKNALRWRGGVIYPRTPDQEARVRDALRKYVPGGDADRWKGDNLPADAPDLRCDECGYFTRNVYVYNDHRQHTKHGATG